MGVQNFSEEPRSFAGKPFRPDRQGKLAGWGEVIENDLRCREALFDRDFCGDVDIPEIGGR